MALTSSDCTADRPHQAHYRTRHLALVAALRPSIIHPAVAVLVEPCRHVDPPAARQPDVSKPDRALAQGLERNRAWCNMVIRLSSSLQARCFQSAVGGANHGAGTEDSATARGGRAGGSFALPGPIAVPLPPCAIFQSCRRKRGGARHGEAAGGGAAVRAASCAELQIAAGGCAVLGAHQCDRHAYNPWPSIRCGWRSRAPPPRLSSSDHEAGITASTTTPARAADTVPFSHRAGRWRPHAGHIRVSASPSCRDGFSTTLQANLQKSSGKSQERQDRGTVQGERVRGRAQLGSHECASR